jgi:hypothetical protein
MISYKSNQLDNLEVQDAAEAAFKKQQITEEEFSNLKKLYPVELYRPNPYVRIGLFILTLIAVFFAFGLFCLIFASSGGESTFGGLACFFGLLCYGGIEFMIHENKHYKSGVDTALMWMSGSAFVAALVLWTDHLNIGPIPFCIIILLISTFFVLRFADVLMSIIAFLSLLCAVFYIFEHAGRMVIPFLTMAVSLGVYLGAKKLANIYTYRHYLTCLQMLQITALITLYLGGNYFVVREVSNTMFELDLQPGQSIPGAIIFWIITVIIPPIYLYFGIKAKDRILIRTGLLLFAGIVFTVRYYYSIAPLEVAMTIGGVIIIAIAYTLTKWLQPEKHGFTSEQTDDDKEDVIQLESLVIAQTFSHTQQPDGFRFGEGTGSGGGASGDF